MSEIFNTDWNRERVRAGMRWFGPEDRLHQSAVRKQRKRRLRPIRLDKRKDAENTDFRNADSLQSVALIFPEFGNSKGCRLSLPLRERL